MKTISKVIYENEYTSNSKWGNKVQSYIKITRHFDFKDGLRYSISMPNFSTCDRKLNNALFRAMERESIGMAKYEGLKELISHKKLWSNIC